MPPIVGLSAQRKIIDIVRMGIGDEGISLSLFVFLIALIFLVYFGFYVEVLISRVSAASLPWPAL